MVVPSISISPNTNGLPGMAALEQIGGALLTFGLIAAVAGIAISAIAWAVGSHSSNPHVAGRGKTRGSRRGRCRHADRRRQHPGHVLQQRRRSNPLIHNPGSALPGRARVAWVAGLILVVLAVISLSVAVAIHFSASGPRAVSPGPSRPQPSAPAALARQPELPSTSAGSSQAAAEEVTRLESSVGVAPATSPQHPRITGQHALQPDLFARAFTQELLTQDYRTPRADLLAWVQAESAKTMEPSVIGQVPLALRDKWAVFSLTEDQPTAAIPNAAEWAAYSKQQGHTTVQIQRVMEPVAWSTAVLSGHVIDPGVTAREVDALVTLHTSENGTAHTLVSSVALTMNLEGPPSGATWGFVTAVTYDAVPGGSP